MKSKATTTADIFDVAKAAGVSISTVSRAFNHPDLVKAQTLKKIDRAVKATGYIRNRAAQMMQGRRSGTIGLIVPTIEHTIFAELVHVFSESLEAEDYSIILSSHNYDLDREYRLLRKMLEHRVDGIALIGQAHKPETWDLLQIQQMPVVSLWNHSEAALTDCVGASNFDAGFTACKHLLDLGHQKIGLIFPEVAGNDRAGDRLKGANAALDQANVSSSDHFTCFSSYSVSAAKQDCKEILSSGRSTALLCGNDVIGRGALHAAMELGLDVPTQQSIMSIGDFKGSADFVPSLSTVRIPSEKIGAEAAETLMQRIAEPAKPLERLEFPVELLPRNSTAKL